MIGAKCLSYRNFRPSFLSRPRPWTTAKTVKWLQHLLTMGFLSYSLFAKIARRQLHHYGEETKLVQCYAMPAVSF